MNCIRTAAMILLAASIAAPAFAQSAGAATYKAKCAMCHGPDGTAATPVAKAMKIVSFKDPTMVKAPDSQFETAVKDGKGKMKGFAGTLSDAQIKEVVSYIRTLQK
jgi:mono/diheme cytochrome c family protein